MQANKKKLKKEILMMLLCMLPALTVAVIAYIVRIEPLCIAATIVAFSVMVFLWDLRVGPVIRYGRFLNEIMTGLSRETVGALVRIGSDPVYQEGNNFYELIINVYEDMSEEGERPFLLDCVKTVEERLIGRDVVVTSHGSYVLKVEPANE